MIAVTFIYIALFTLQIVSKQHYRDNNGNIAKKKSMSQSSLSSVMFNFCICIYKKIILYVYSHSGVNHDVILKLSSYNSVNAGKSILLLDIILNANLNAP